MTSSYGSLEIVREILDIEEGEETRKIIKLKRLSNVWLDSYVHSDILSDVSIDVKNAAVEYHTIYLFRLSSEKFSSGSTDFATEWKDNGKELIDREILKNSEIYIIKKVNK